MLTSMEMRVNPRVNSVAQLGTVDHRAPEIRALFVDCIDWTTEHPERELGIFERADKCTEFRFLIDVLLDILLKKRSPLKIPFGIFWLGRRRKGYIPTKTKSLDDLVGVEITV